MVNKKSIEYIELYGSEAGSAVEYFSTMSEDLNIHIDKWAQNNGNVIVFPDALQHFDCKTGKPTLNSHIRDKVQLEWNRGEEYKSDDGSVFIGHKVNDKKEGFGELTMPDGSKYQGDFVDDKFHGNGVFTEKDGTTKYIGKFENNERHGYGLVTIKGELDYEGNFVNGLKHGVITEVQRFNEVIDKFRDPKLYDILK